MQTMSTCAVMGLISALSVMTSAYGADLADGVRITQSRSIPPGTYRIADADGDGAIIIEGDGITVDFRDAHIQGNSPGQAPDQYTGKGVVVRGKDITVKNLRVSGYKVGIHAVNCPGLTIEDSDISGNYQKHLLSTPEAEDNSDWIFPHNNDEHNWMQNYGAGLYVELSNGVTLRRIRARDGQNGIIIDRVNDSKIYDNDCSFLSGWGLAMWRSNGNVITRNAFDFCIRGYSHGVYNRGQDSAGILAFEQNSNNVIAENSATHGGDGFFGFAGLEALGDKPPPAGFTSKRAGNNDNLLIGNDFSYAAAHGIEMTFSFGNQFVDNRLAGNAICGVWGGYCQDTLIGGNQIIENGEMGYGLERGGINIDSGRKNRILGNHFEENKCGVHLWGPASASFLEKPWAKANQPASTDNVIAGNTFEGDRLALHLRGQANNTIFAENTLKGVGKSIEKPAGVEVETSVAESKAEWKRPEYRVYGESRPVGARKELAGRQNIIMTDWGPYDFEDTIVCPREIHGSQQASFRVLGPSGSFRVTRKTGDVTVSPSQGPLPATVTVSSDNTGLQPFTIELVAGEKKLSVTGVLVRTKWEVKFFKWSEAEDPREHPTQFRAVLENEPAMTLETDTLDFKWGGGGPGPAVGSDRFATVATTSISLPAGRYRLWTLSDDGIRVWLDGEQVIDDWTWHPPKENVAERELKAGEHTIRVEHFEIDGFSQLQFRIEPLGD